MLVLLLVIAATAPLLPGGMIGGLILAALILFRLLTIRANSLPNRTVWIGLTVLVLMENLFFFFDWIGKL